MYDYEIDNIEEVIEQLRKHIELLHLVKRVSNIESNLIISANDKLHNAIDLLNAHIVKASEFVAKRDNVRRN